MRRWLWWLSGYLRIDRIRLEAMSFMETFPLHEFSILAE